MLSRATSRATLKLVNFTSDKIKVNEPALAEMERMRKNSFFHWKHPLSMFDYQNQVHIGFLNIRSLNAHIEDLKADIYMQNLSALCLTETHTNHISQAHQLQNFKVYSKETQHGLAIYSRVNADEYLVRKHVNFSF